MRHSFQVLDILTPRKGRPLGTLPLGWQFHYKGWRCREPSVEVGAGFSWWRWSESSRNASSLWPCLSISADSSVLWVLCPPLAPLGSSRALLGRIPDLEQPLLAAFLPCTPKNKFQKSLLCSTLSRCPPEGVSHGLSGWEAHSQLHPGPPASYCHLQWPRAPLSTWFSHAFSSQLSDVGVKLNLHHKTSLNRGTRAYTSNNLEQGVPSKLKKRKCVLISWMRHQTIDMGFLSP